MSARRVREGDVLAISEPRNNFPLRRDTVRTLFIAGGIGITPLLAMAQALHHSNLVYELHYFARGREGLAFPERLRRSRSSRHPSRSRRRRPRTHSRAVIELSAARACLCMRSGADAGRDARHRLGIGLAEVAGPFRIFQECQGDRRQLRVSRWRWHVPSSRWRCRREDDPPGLARKRHRHSVVLRAGRVRHVPRDRARRRTGSSGRVSQRRRERSGTKIITCVSRAKSPRLVLDL